MIEEGGPVTSKKRQVIIVKARRETSSTSPKKTFYVSRKPTESETLISLEPSEILNTSPTVRTCDKFHKFLL